MAPFIMVTFRKDGGPPRNLYEVDALRFYRAFRGALWDSGTRRDPKPGDVMFGVEIVAIAI